MHVALYRKWRPRTFDDVCGQEHITTILKYEIERAEFSHAYLFCGSRGTGKTTCAKILAKAVNCEHPIDGSPCGVCDSCKLVESGGATDILEMDAASNNGVDNIRDIRDEVIYTPSALKYKVYIIDEVHMLSGSAFNALLKTLEEPPAHIIFILATTELNKLPATIISRCQRFDFRRISIQVLTERILYIAEKESIEIEVDAARLIARLAQGGMRDAISLFELCAGNKQKITVDLVNETVGSTGRERVIEIVKAICNKDYETIFSLIADAVSSSKDLSTFATDLLSFYRDLLIVKTTSASKKYLDLTDNENDSLAMLSKHITKETLLYNCKVLDDTIYSMTRNSSSKRTVLELALIRLCDETLDSSVEAVLSRISALEEKLQRSMNFDYSSKKDTFCENDAKKVDSKSSKESAFDTVAPKHTKPSGNSSETLKAINVWMDLIDTVSKDDESIAGFLKLTEAYKTTENKIKILTDSDFTIDMLKSSTDRIAVLLSNLLGENIQSSNIIFETRPRAESNKNQSFIDELI